jgi:hypothetical protein
VRLDIKTPIDPACHLLKRSKRAATGTMSKGVNGVEKALFDFVTHRDLHGSHDNMIAYNSECDANSCYRCS